MTFGLYISLLAALQCGKDGEVVPLIQHDHLAESDIF